MGRGFQHFSGRVVGIGRLLQAALFLLAILADETQPGKAVAAVYSLLAFYVVFAAAIAAATWSNWWLDARLAGPAHGIDILMFTLLALATEGYTSPLFAFFVFLLLAAAIRWSWRATALTAALLTLLYLGAGLVISETESGFELEPFMVGTGHLVMISLILILFGATQWRARFRKRDEAPPAIASLGEIPLENILRSAMSDSRASSGQFVWHSRGAAEASVVAISSVDSEPVTVPATALSRAVAMTPFLYDFGKDRALMRDRKRNVTAFQPSDVVAPVWSKRLALGEGLAIPVRTDDGEGAMFLERGAGMAIDHLDLGEQIAADAAAQIQRHALLKWADENAEARSRLSLARDLHDSVVQFLAGAAFRVEAMKRSEASGRSLEADLNELKQLMLHEQSELRSFITALRSGSLVAFNDLARDLEELAGRLARHWNVRCEFSARPADLMVPTRFRLNALHLMREGVANAVRHAKASVVTVKLAVVADNMRLTVVNDGADFPMRGGRPVKPASLSERVEQAGGALDVSRGMDITKITITLPIGGSRP